MRPTSISSRPGICYEFEPTPGRCANAKADCEGRGARLIKANTVELIALIENELPGESERMRPLRLRLTLEKSLDDTGLVAVLENGI